MKITKTANAAAAITRGLCVILGPHGTTSTTPLATKVTTAGAEVHGIIDAGYEATAADDMVNVCIFGLVKAIAGEAFSIGAKLYVDAAGKVADTAAGDNLPIGIALQEAKAANEMVEIFFNPQLVDATGV